MDGAFGYFILVRKLKNIGALSKISGAKSHNFEHMYEFQGFSYVLLINWISLY